MIEVTICYQLLPDVDYDEYWEFQKKRLPSVFNAEGFKELRAHRDLVVPELVRISLVWESAEAWIRFAATDAWRAVMKDARRFGEDFEVREWIISDYVPEPLRT